MSGTTSTAVKVEDHRARLRDLVEEMHRSVVAAAVATDRVAKIELWEAYRTARVEAIMLSSARSVPGTPRLRSI